MYQARIRLAFRIVIDHTAISLWDRYVFEDTFREYDAQQRLFNTTENPKHTFAELLSENPKAQQLHYLVGIAADGYIRQLKGKLNRVPDLLGKHALPFTNFELDIIGCDVREISKYKIGITFYSPLLTLVDTIDNAYLVSENTEAENGFETMMFPFQPGLAVCYFERNPKASL